MKVNSLISANLFFFSNFSDNEVFQKHSLNAST
jgi:hypothetical protein